MKKYLKKISALLMAAIMVLSMCTAVFAATGAVPKDGDAAQVTINGLESGVTIKAYQIVDGVYKDNKEGFTGFTWTDLSGKSGDIFTKDSTGNQILNLSQAELNTIVGKINDRTPFKTITLGANNLSNETLEVGTWLLVVSGGTKVYNPMVVSVYYSTDDGAIIGGTLNAGADWNLVGGVTYAKETDVTIDKTATKDTAAHGEDVDFTITGVIPSYSAEYTNVTYKISDTLTNLELNGTPVVSLAGQPVAEANYDYKTTETGFEISFHSDYIKSLAKETDANRTVTVTYTATVTADATTWNPANNKATVDYTNNPNGSTTGKTTETNTYTFDINGQILKVDEKEEALGDAEFTLYRKYEDKVLSDEVAKYTTAKDGDLKGQIIFKGLKAGTYYLTETKAPDSYTLNTTVYRITITPTYESEAAETGKKVLTSYKVTVEELDKDGKVVKKIESDGYTKENPTVSELLKIKNTKVGQLPSTGGMGTYIFTIAGVVLMACAAGAFIISRKKSSEE